MLGMSRGLLTGGGYDLLAVLGDGGVHDLVVLLMALLPGGLHLPGVAGGHGDGLTDGRRHGSVAVPGLGLGVGLGLASDEEGLGGSGEEEDGEELHDGRVELILPT